MRAEKLVFATVALSLCLMMSALPSDAWVNGTGKVSISRSVVNWNDAFEYYNTLSGDGHLEIGSMSPTYFDSSNSSYGVKSNAIRMTYSGNVPLVGSKRIESTSLSDGTKASIRESFSANQMVSEHTHPFGSKGSRGVGTNTKISFNGTYETSSSLHQTFYKDVNSRQKYTGNFDIDKEVSFVEPEHQKPSLSLDVSPSNSWVGVGTTFTRHYNVANTGQVPIDDIWLIDSLLGPITLKNSHLEPGEVAIVEADYTITEKDVRIHQSMNNTIQVFGSDSQGNLVVASVKASLNLIFSSCLNLTVVPYQNNDTFDNSEIYLYSIENCGDLTVFDLNLTDPMVVNLNVVDSVLLPGERLNLTANRAIFDGELPGELYTKAFVLGIDSMGKEVADVAKV